MRAMKWVLAALLLASVPAIYTNPAHAQSQPPVGMRRDGSNALPSVNLPNSTLTAQGFAMMPNSQTWSGGAYTQAPMYSAPAWSGTSTISSDYTPLAIYLNPQDNLAATTATADVQIEHVVGPHHTGNVAGVASTIDVAFTPASTGEEFSPLAGRTNGNVNAGGTSETPSGHAYGVNAGATLNCNSDASCATYYGIVSGAEFAASIFSGAGGTASAADKYGIYILQYSGDAAQGYTKDEAIAIYNQQNQNTGDKGWNIGLGFGSTDQYFPVSPTGTVIEAVKGGSDGALTVGSLIDFSAIGTVSNYDVKMPNFTVSGAGVGGMAGGFSVGTGYGTFPNSSDLLAGFTNFNGTASLTLDNISSGANAIAQLYFANSTGTKEAWMSLNGGSNTAGSGENSFDINGKSGIWLQGNGNNAIIIGTSADVTVGAGSALATAATAGFLHLPFTAAAPTGTPATINGNACEINTATDNLNCYVGSSWYHLTMTSGAG